MNQLVVVGFAGRHRADEVMLDALKANNDALAFLEDAVVVTRDRSGKLRIKPYADIIGAITGHRTRLWGELISTIHEKDDKTALGRVGINLTTCQAIDALMQPDSSLIYLLLSRADFSELQERVHDLGGRVILASLIDAEDRHVADLLAL
ncbi:hypothetical protein EVJ50_02365 [Synechococcus sp. RSCCF101]|uniref:hypothetical protein n=1 Tax=Synechococcus sp. RSCCF101 TaxID=2511069 RepID=UPI0012476B96|nr:hypothetical protein [Synechococcus sp. RSCCF101]QEY31260.1 hypothetical protein EVJ50_02365 [Synechococcus sp. RSCCF101]